MQMFPFQVPDLYIRQLREMKVLKLFEEISSLRLYKNSTVVFSLGWVIVFNGKRKAMKRNETFYFQLILFQYSEEDTEKNRCVIYTRVVMLTVFSFISIKTLTAIKSYHSTNSHGYKSIQKNEIIIVLYG